MLLLANGKGLLLRVRSRRVHCVWLLTTHGSVEVHLAVVSASVAIGESLGRLHLGDVAGLHIVVQRVRMEDHVAHG